MADGEKKGGKAIAVIYYIAVTLAAAAFGFFGYMKLTDTELYLFNSVIGCYTICFGAVLGFTVIRFLTLLKKNGNKFNYPIALMLSAAGIAGACFVNSLAEDIGRSKVKDILEMDETTKIFLCEVSDKEDRSVIDVYRVRDRFVHKIGTIDERLFSVKCIEGDLYSYSFSEDKSLVTIQCQYGVYGDGLYMLNPSFDTGVLNYTFKIG